MMSGGWLRRMDSVSCVQERSRFSRIQLYSSSNHKFFNFVLSTSKSNPPPTPHPVLSTRCFSGYSCRLVTHGMSLIIVNEDSLDVSTASSYSVWRTAYRFVQYWGFMCVFVCAQEGGPLCGGVLSRLLWELGCGPQPDWWVGLFVCTQVQIIKVSGVPLEKGMKWDNLNYHFFPSVSFTTSHTVLHFMYRLYIQSSCVLSAT